MSDQTVQLGVLPCVPSPQSIGEKHRCSVLDMNTQYPPGGTTQYQWIVTDAKGQELPGVQFSVKNNQTFKDPVIFKNLSSGSRTDYEPQDALYISDPVATGDFYVSVEAVIDGPGSFPQESWMGDAGEKISAVQLNNLPITGSHDSGSFGIARNSPKGAGASALLPSPAGLLTDTARAQGWSWEQMLLAGVRYFDVRLSTFPGVKGQLKGYYLIHSWIGELMESMLATFDRFLKQHPQEVLVLDFQHQSGFDDSDHDAVAQAIEQQLGPYLAGSDDFGPTSTIGSFWSGPARIVVVYEDTDDNAPPPSFFEKYNWAWPRSRNMRSVWGDKHSVSALIDFLNGEINNKPADLLWVLQCQLTTPYSELLNLQSAAKDTNPAIQNWLDTTVAADPVNIVMIDWVQYGGIEAVTLNRALA